MKCSECGREFESARSLAAHERSHDTKHKCPRCGKEVSYLGSHMLRTHGVGHQVDPVDSLLRVLAENERLRAENERLRGRLDPI